ncbi:unnamed protein product [Paramecium sonneborni]|uniref:RING-type domain-containing protein n=1 Tax=Paramecium sonneborni TaxID=65129 RepID=A0A8S1R952_9CILI|nr:unnamed protein product [Paramecium sonneborni]
MKTKQILIIQKQNQKFTQLLYKQVNENIDEDNQIIPYNKLGKFKIEGWLNCQNLSQTIQLNCCELNIKENQQDQIYLYSQNIEIGRFQYKGEKILYYLLCQKYLRIHVEVNQTIQKCISNKEFIVVQIQIEINLYVNPFLFNQDNTFSQQNQIKFILALLKLQDLLKRSFLFYLYPIEKKIQLSGPCYSSNIILKWMIEREKDISSISNQKFRGGVFVEIKQGYIFDRFYDLISHKARLQIRKSQTLIITFDQSIVEEKKQEIQKKYPHLSVLCINQEVNLNCLLIFDIIIISIHEVEKQYENFKQQYLNTIYSFGWKRIIVDLSILESQLIYNLYFINLLKTKYKWIFLKNFDEQIKRGTLNFILEFFTLEKKAFVKYFSIENQPQQQKRCLTSIASQLQISFSQISIKNQIILIDFNYDEQYQYNELRYKNLENHNLDDYGLKFNLLRQFCSVVRQNYDIKQCSICFLPLENNYKSLVCSHFFCFQCLQYACLLCDKKITQAQIQKIRLQNSICDSPTVKNKQIKLIQLIQNLQEKILILTQYPNKLEQLFFDSNLSLYNVKNLSYSQRIDDITQQVDSFDESDKKTILILNPQQILEQSIIIKSAHFIIFYDQIWNIHQEDIIMKRVYNIKAIFRFIVKGGIEENIIYLQHLQSKKRGREGILENYSLIKKMLKYQQQ